MTAAPHRGLVGPGLRPGFLYVELSEVSPMEVFKERERSRHFASTSLVCWALGMVEGNGAGRCRISYLNLFAFVVLAERERDRQTDRRTDRQTETYMAGMKARKLRKVSGNESIADSLLSPPEKC